MIGIYTVNHEQTWRMVHTKNIKRKANKRRMLQALEYIL